MFIDIRLIEFTSIVASTEDTALDLTSLTGTIVVVDSVVILSIVSDEESWLPVLDGLTTLHKHT
jgi:hypothetical protein